MICTGNCRQGRDCDCRYPMETAEGGRSFDSAVHREAFPPRLPITSNDEDYLGPFDLIDRAVMWIQRFFIAIVAVRVAVGFSIGLLAKYFS
jgi:hypothetical protein